MSKKFLSPIKLAQGASTPSSGSSGELFYNTTDKKVYAHNGTSWLPSGGGVTNSDTAPTTPANGDAWFNTAEGSLFIYYADGTSGQWVEATNNVNNAEPNQIPAGAIMAWSSSVIPNNWLLCDGSAVSRVTYASLFAAVGTTYGVGDGSTTFNLPDLRGRAVVGFDTTQTEFNFLGETGGAKTHTLTVSEMPSHTHIQDSHNHTQNSHNHTQNAHSHLSVINLSLVNTRTAGSNTFNSDGAADKSGGIASTTATNNPTTATNNATTATNQNTGGGGAHNNLQPYIVLNYIIKHSAGETPGDSQLAVRVGTLETQNNATPLSQNYVINGAFDFWQRGTSSTTNGYLADRFNVLCDATFTASRQSFSAGTSFTGTSIEPSFFHRIAKSSGGTYSTLFQRIESVRTFANKVFTISFWAKSDIAVTLNIRARQEFGSGGSTSVDIATNTTSLTTTWARYSFTYTAPSISGKTIGSSDSLLIEMFTLGSGAVTWDVWGVQVEEGATATPFRRNAPSIQAEFAACQRYYEIFQARRLNNEGYAPGTGYGYYRSIGWAVTKRVAPTVTLPTTTAKVTSNELSYSDTDGYIYQFASNAAGNFYMLWNAGLIGTASAEL